MNSNQSVSIDQIIQHVRKLKKANDLNEIVQLPQVVSEQGTNINNTNNTNYTNNDINNTNNFTLCAVTKANEVLRTPSVPVGTPSVVPQGGEPICPRRGVVVDPEDRIANRIPPEWRALKIDLYQNWDMKSNRNYYKLKFNIYRLDSTPQALIANLNSPPHRIFTRVEEDEMANNHWTKVSQFYQRLREQKISFYASKCGLLNKKGSTDLVVFYIDQEQECAIIIFRQGQKYTYIMTKDQGLTDKQKKHNQIGTLTLGKMAKIINVEELGI